MSPRSGSASLKPPDERWQFDVLLYVIAYRYRHERGPTWREVFEVMRWERKPFANVIRMRKLTRQGLVFDERERSLDVSPAGRAQLRQLLATRKADASGEELDS